MVGIPNRCHTTDLFAAIELSETETFPKMLKLGFFQILLGKAIHEKYCKHLLKAPGALIEV